MITTAKLGITAAVIVGLLGGVWMYGNHRESTGFEKRDIIAKKELWDRQTALYEEQYKNERLREENDRKFQELKAKTDKDLADTRRATERLRELADEGIRAREQAKTLGGVADEGVDWIGVFAACYSEYGMLGADAARIADKLRGLQDSIDSR